MPTSIVVTIAALGVMIALNLVLGLVALMQDPTNIGQAGGSLALSVLILCGMIFGHRLAWQWGRILGIIVAVLSTIGAVAFFAAPGNVPGPAWLRFLFAAVLLLQAACLFTIFFALGRPSAKLHFELRCPECGKFTSTAADFFFNRAKCRACGNVW